LTPDFEMAPHWYELEEIVGRSWDRWASRAASYPRHPQAAVPLASISGVLESYFRALGGSAGLGITSASARTSGHRLSLRQRLGMERESLAAAWRDDESLMLPAELDFFADPSLNRDLYLWLAAWLARAQAPLSAADPLQQDLAYLREAHRVSCVLSGELPGVAARYRRLCAALLEIRPRRRLPPIEAALEAVIRSLLGAREVLNPAAERLLAAVTGAQAPGDAVRAPAGYRPPLPVPMWGRVVSRSAGRGRGDAAPPPAASASDAGDRGRRRAERRDLDQADRDDPFMMSPFEKILSWTEMVNVNRAVEDDEPDTAARAADQLETLTLSQNRKQAATRLRIELDLAAGAAAEHRLDAPVTYPEWHYRRQRLLSDYCAVATGPSPSSGERWEVDAGMARRIRAVRRQFEALRPQRTLARGQPDGDALDTDALVRSRCDIAAGGHGSDDVFLSWRAQARDLSVAILVDVSLSTETWVEDRRVLDVEKEALFALTHGLSACGDEHAIYTFTSRRRNVQVATVKAFDEPLGADVERRIAALRPGLYTRMGAAVRHVTHELERRSHRHRLLLLLTDGKPNDSDHYEGRYAVEDTRQAVIAARRSGLTVFGITVDREAQQYFPRIFGRGAFSIVARPSGLTRALPIIYRQIVG
jgi:nitric oxide reductase NorD protein